MSWKLEFAGGDSTQSSARGWTLRVNDRGLQNCAVGAIKIIDNRHDSLRRHLEDRAASRAVEVPIGCQEQWSLYVVGSFQVKIPVETKKTMLPVEENTLAICW
jgi:hypothetical protein